MSKYDWGSLGPREQSIADGRFASEVNDFDDDITRLAGPAQVKAILAELIAQGNPDDIINVQSGPYHARGDGVTDDTEAIQEALAAGAARGAAVYFPAGTYRVVPNLARTSVGGGLLAAFDLASNLHLFSHGQATIKIGNGVSTDLAPQKMAMFFTDAALRNVSFRGLTLDMNGANNPISPSRPVSYNFYNQAHIFVSGDSARIDDVLIHDCEFLNTAGATCIGLGQTNTNSVTLGQRWVIAHCKFLNNGLDIDDHTSVYGWADDVLVTGCEFANDDPYHTTGLTGAQTAYEVHGSHHRFVANSVRNYQRMAYVANNTTSTVQDVVIADNVASPLQGSGIDFFSDNALSVLKDIQIRGNTFGLDDLSFTGLPSVKFGVSLTNSYAASDVLIAGNVCRKLSGTTVGSKFCEVFTGAGASQTNTRIVIRDNLVYNTSLGVDIQPGPTNALGFIEVSNNTFTDLTAAGALTTTIGVFTGFISVDQGIEQLVIDNNTFLDTRGSPSFEYGIYISGDVGILRVGRQVYQGLTTANYIEAGSPTITDRRVWHGDVEVFNVKDYGAKGDGTTDDTAAIQAALDAVGSDGGTVSFPVGKYIVTSALIIKVGGIKLVGGGMSGKVLSVSTVRGATQLIGMTSGMTILRCRGVNDDGTTYMQAGPVIEGIAFIDGLAQPGIEIGTMTGLEIRVANRWHLRECGFFYCLIGLKASKDTLSVTTGDCAQWTVTACTFTYCGTGAWFNTFTGSVRTSWANGCDVGYLIAPDAVAQVCSGVAIDGCKFDILEPTVTTGWSVGVGVSVGEAQNVTVEKCLFETQPGNLDAFTTTAVLVNGATSNTRVNVTNSLFSNVNKGVYAAVAECIRIVNCIGRSGTGAGALVVDSMISLDSVVDALLVGTRSDTVVNPIVKMTGLTTGCTVIGHTGSVVRGTTDISDAPVQVWNSGSMRSLLDNLGGLLQREQASDPSAPASNRALTYARDDGAGFTQLVTRFNSGPVKILASEATSGGVDFGAIKTLTSADSPYTAVAGFDHTLFCDTSGGNITINLPSATTAADGDGVEFAVVKTTADANTVTIDPSGAQTIGGAATTLLSGQFRGVVAQSNGTNWIITAGAGVGGTGLALATLASPTFTGTPAAPTATANDNSTKLATTAYVDRATTHTGTTSAAPTGTTSATAVMMGLAGSITPTRGTKINVLITGQMSNDTVNNGVTVDARFGTGTAPTNGAAVTGTLVGIAQTMTAKVAAERSGFALSGKVTGLSVGTAYWLDLTALAITGGTASVTGVSITAWEVP